MKHLFELLQVALECRSSLPASLSDAEWLDLHECAVKQTLVGICYTGILRLSPEQRPSADNLILWYGLTRNIEEHNRLMNTRSLEACRYFEQHGFHACVLKGQGNAQLYPWPLRRQSGDIDVWLIPMEGHENGAVKKIDLKKTRQEVLLWVKKRYPKARANLRHVQFPILQDIEMEIHFVPSFMRCPLANRRLRAFYESEALMQMEHRMMLD